MQKSVIVGPFRAKPDEVSGRVTFRHPNGKWYQRRVSNRGNTPQGGRRARHPKVAVIRDKEKKP